MPQVTLTVDGQETTHEVSLDAITLDEGSQILTSADLARSYIPISQTTGEDALYIHKNSVKDRYKNYVNKNKAHEDETVVSKVLSIHGEAAKAEGLEEAKKQWAKAELEPVLSERDAAIASKTAFEQQVVRSAIDASATKVWGDAFATAPPGGQSWAQVNFATEAQWDPKQSEVIAVRVDGDGNRVPRPSLNPTEARPHMSILEYQQMLAKEDAWSAYARPADTVTSDDDLTSGPKGGEKPVSEWTVAEKAAYSSKHGAKAYQQLLQEQGLI